LTTASASLNPILARWLSPDSVETAVLDCSSCSRALKCCDFQPFVANFLLGAMLSAGRGLPEAGADFSYQPLGLVPSASFRARHAATPEFERGEDLLCAFYDRASRQCAVWSARPGECSTYLCTPPSEARTRFSERSFAVETGLSQMALALQGFSPREISEQIDFLNTPEGGIEAAGDVFEIYRRSWVWAQGLSAKEVAAILEEKA
jgi:hypothetical protein